MPAAGVFSAEGWTDDTQAQVSAADRPGVADMAFRLVFDLDLTGAKDFQPLAQLGDGGGVHQAGNTFLNGCTLTWA